MKIFDISQELFDSSVYPGDPRPEKTPVLSTEKGDICNLTLLQMGSHNGTHMDAPRHFYGDGKDIQQIPLNKCVGECKVVSDPKKEEQWIISGQDVDKILEDGTNKLLIKGNILITEEAARRMAKSGLEFLGVESQTVGNPEDISTVHLILLGAEIVIVEGLRMQDISDGLYFLASAPLKMAGLDGSPVRPVLLDTTTMLPGYDDNGIHRLSIDDIYYFESVDDRVFIYCKDAVYQSKKKLYELETVSGNFFRASKSVVLNIDVIEFTRPSLSGRFRAMLTNGEEVEISRQYVPVLKRMLGG